MSHNTVTNGGKTYAITNDDVRMLVRLKGSRAYNSRRTTNLKTAGLVSGSGKSTVLTSAATTLLTKLKK